MTGTYGGDKKYGRVSGNQKTKTAGGYSAANTVHEDFVLKIHQGMKLDRTAPILCAGITMYSPLKHWGATKGEKMTIGIVGIGEFIQSTVRNTSMNPKYYISMK